MIEYLLDVYWGVAIASSVLFLWQMLATLFGGIGGAEQADAGSQDLSGAAHDVAVASADQAAAVHGADTIISFNLLSIRSITAFGLLFGWAGVLYARELGPDDSPDWTIIISFLWGGVGMLMVSLVFYFFARMTETGTQRLATCVGQRGTVYMDIPAGGAGRIKTTVSGVVAFVSARTAGGEALKAGAEVTVQRLLDATTVEVEKVVQE
jgi:hypothetical protein